MCRCRAWLEGLLRRRRQRAIVGGTRRNRGRGSGGGPVGAAAVVQQLVLAELERSGVCRGRRDGGGGIVFALGEVAVPQRESPDCLNAGWVRRRNNNDWSNLRERLYCIIVKFYLFLLAFKLLYSVALSCFYLMQFLGLVGHNGLKNVNFLCLLLSIINNNNLINKIIKAVQKKMSFLANSI